jgi:leukotriene-A4 hydrolase
VAARVVLQLIVVALALMPAVAVAASDELSAARPDEARVTHVALDLVADFSSRTLAGAATLSLAVAPGARSLVLDTRDLEIESVADASGRMLAFRLDEGNAVIGRPLHVTLEPGSTSLTIRYRTSPGAAALQWLAPEQTAGRRHPYLFSQGQAILTRTWIPTQDSPGIRQTYTARIVVPRELRAVMSAEHLTPGGVEVANGRAFEFRMEQPIPPYLIALAVGDIAFRSLGSRTGVFAEPAVLDRAAYEFGEVEQMLESAERLYGPYRWDRYDILVLPPSFPYGGMENPRLTFATPTILAGDRSLTSLIAHELAHSWSGNLVTNATWRDFWLNEGFTTYFENRIMEALHGRERAEMLEYLGRRELLEAIARHTDDPRATTLYTTEGPLDPDAALSTADYEKGAAFLRMLEVNLGRDRFDRWLRSYFDRFAFQPMTTPRFHEELRANLLGGDEALERKLLVDEWLYKPGLPANASQPAPEAFTRVEEQVQRFVGGTPASELRATKWSTQEWQHFLQNLPATLTTTQLADLDRTFGLSTRGNSEVLFSWLRIAIRHRYEPALPALEQFLTSQGRRKFVQPLFDDLVTSGWGEPLARRIYARARELYHPVTQRSVDETLARKGGSG